MAPWSWADSVMMGALLVHLASIREHVRLGRRMFDERRELPDLSSSRWVPDRNNARQKLLLGMFWVAVPMWITHVVAIALVLRYARDLAFAAGLVAGSSMILQGAITAVNLGTSRGPGRILVGHYGAQTVAAFVWAAAHSTIGGSR